MRWWFNLHRHNTRPLKDRNMHKLERALIIWPLHLYAKWKTRKTSSEVFFNTHKEDA